MYGYLVELNWSQKKTIEMKQLCEKGECGLNRISRVTTVQIMQWQLQVATFK